MQQLFLDHLNEAQALLRNFDTIWKIDFTEAKRLLAAAEIELNNAASILQYLQYTVYLTKRVGRVAHWRSAALAGEEERRGHGH
jgi:hypothetical protein